MLRATIESLATRCRYYGKLRIGILTLNRTDLVEWSPHPRLRFFNYFFPPFLSADEVCVLIFSCKKPFPFCSRGNQRERLV